MGKRSNFERVERDFYPTPMAAVVPLIRHLPDNCLFWEPCAGDGALINNLEAQGVECFFASDIHPQGCWMGSKIDKLDALWVTEPLIAECNYIITNPPWDRKILHPMIEHFSAMKPTWLLFDADWVHTKQSAPYVKYLRKIVSVGRVKWIPDSKMTGKDNCAWHLFDQTGVFTGPATFHGRAV